VNGTDSARTNEGGPAKGKSRNQGRKRRLKQAWQQTSLPNKLLVWIQLVTFLAVAIYSVETFFLWNVSKQSADIALSAVNENKRQFDILQKNRAADTIENNRRFDLNSKESKRQAEAALSASREQAERALNESKRQSEAANQLARETIAVSRRQMLESLRAKVFSEGLTVDFDKTPPVLSGNFRNSGALAAERLSWGTSVAWGKAERAATPQMVEYANFIIPGGNHPFGTDLPLSPEVIEAVKTGTIPLWVWIRIKYGDRLTSLYEVETACFTYNARYKWMVYCESAAQPAPPLP
jgi:hypothetical protein